MAAIKVPIYNQDGTSAGEQTLDPKVFGVKANPALIHEVVVAQEANSRETISHTKTRGEVRGGGKKPWKQKHTGRARHGSTRSPIWVGGGIVFGPRNTRVWGKKVNKKAKKAALRMILSDKAADGHIIVLSSLDVPEYKTRIMADLIKKLPLKGKKTLVAPVSVPETVWKSAANIPTLSVSPAGSLNIIDLLAHQNLVITAEAVSSLTKALS